MILARAFLHLCSSRQRILQCWAISCANNHFLQGKKMSIFYSYVKKAYKLQRSRSSCLYKKTLIGPINRILGLISEQILTSKTLPPFKCNVVIPKSPAMSTWFMNAPCVMWIFSVEFFQNYI